MNCQKFEKLIALHVEGDLDERAARKVVAHLGGCASCQRLAAELKQSQAGLRAFGQWPIDPRHRDALHRAVMAEIAARPELIEKKRLWSVPEIRWRPAFTVLAFMAIAISGAQFLWDISNRKPPGAPPSRNQPVVQGETPVEVETGKSEPARADSMISPKKAVRRYRAAAVHGRAKSERPSTPTHHSKGTSDADRTGRAFSIPPFEVPRIEPPAVAAAKTKPSSSTDQTLVELITDDPNVIIFWVIENSGG